MKYSIQNFGSICKCFVHVVSYCDQIGMTMEYLENDCEVFSTNAVYCNAVSFFLLQIGELVGHSSNYSKVVNPFRGVKSN